MHPARPNAGDPPSYRRWGIQLGEWVACVVAARAICGTIVVLLGSSLVHIARVGVYLRMMVVGSPAVQLGSM